jgi:hypothetical protein
LHLIQNLAEALTQVFMRHGQALDAVNTAGGQQPVLLPDGTSAVPVPPPPTPPAEQFRAAQRAARRQAVYEAARSLAAARDDQCAGGSATLCHGAPGRLCGRQSWRDAALVQWPGRGAHQPPQNVEEADVWPRAPRSPSPSHCPGPTSSANSGGPPTRAGPDVRDGGVATRATRSVTDHALW